MRGWALLLIGAAALASGCRNGDRAREAAAWRELEVAAAPVRTYGPTDDLMTAMSLILSVDAMPRVDPTDLAGAELRRDELPPEARDAVAALVRWDQAGGGMPATDCAASDTARAAWRLSQVALVVAGEDAGSPARRAVSLLATRLRDEAPTMLEGIIAARIADSSRAWATARDQPPDEAAQGYRPTEDSLIRLVAAEALCTVEFTVYPEVLTGVPHDDAARGRVIATVVPPIRRYWIDVIALLRARADDPDAIDARIDARTEAVARDLDPIPPGIENAPRLIARIREQDDLYREWLATAGVGP